MGINVRLLSGIFLTGILLVSCYPGKSARRELDRFLSNDIVRVAGNDDYLSLHGFNPGYEFRISPDTVVCSRKYPLITVQATMVNRSDSNLMFVRDPNREAVPPPLEGQRPESMRPYLSCFPEDKDKTRAVAIYYNKLQRLYHRWFNRTPYPGKYLSAQNYNHEKYYTVFSIFNLNELSRRSTSKWSMSEPGVDELHPLEPYCILAPGESIRVNATFDLRYANRHIDSLSTWPSIFGPTELHNAQMIVRVDCLFGLTLDKYSFKVAYETRGFGRGERVLVDPPYNDTKRAQAARFFSNPITVIIKD